MPIILQVPVDIPPQKTISCDFLQEELIRYAKSVVENSAEMPENHQPTMTQEDYERNYISLDELSSRLHAHVDELFDKKEVCA